MMEVCGQRQQGRTVSDEARLDRWTSVGCAKQVLGRSRTKGAFKILYMYTICGMLPKDDIMWFLLRKVGS